MKRSLPVLLALTAMPALAEETRSLDAHEHGVGALNIAVDGSKVAMEFTAPGADIVGFEYEATSAEDRAAIDAAVATLAKPLDLFVLPTAAECSVTQASAVLESEDDHDHEEHGHDDHAEAKDEHDHDHDHDHEEHAEAHEDHDDHDHEEHAEAHDDHDEHDHEEHASDEASHTEFHAEYMLTCANPDAINEMTFAYFDTFENARELEIQIVTASGAQAFEVERDDPTLDLRNLF